MLMGTFKETSSSLLKESSNGSVGLFDSVSIHVHQWLLISGLWYVQESSQVQKANAL